MVFPAPAGMIDTTAPLPQNLGQGASTATMPRLLAIDYGQARVGLAVTDPGGTVVFALRTIAWETRDALFRELLAVMAQQAPTRIVVGYPARAGGDEGLTGRQVRNFIARLRRRTDIPVACADEAHSTEEAAERLRAAGLSGRELAARLDAEAAAVILERYLRGGELCCDPSSSASSSSASDWPDSSATGPTNS